jgi:hypothetical protein
MTDKERIEMLERENEQLKIYLDFFSKQSEILMRYVLEDIKIRTEQANQEVQEFMKNNEE